MSSVTSATLKVKSSAELMSSRYYVTVFLSADERSG